VCHDPHQRVRRAPRRDRLAPTHRCGRARLPAFHHGACCSEPTPQLSSRTRFLGRGIVRCYLTANLSQSSDQVADRSSCRPGVFPKPPGSEGDKPSPAGTALAPPAVSPASVLQASETWRSYSNATAMSKIRLAANSTDESSRYAQRVFARDAALLRTNNKETKKIRNTIGQTRTAPPSTTRTWPVL
jgi:hypothetical protein